MPASRDDSGTVKATAPAALARADLDGLFTAAYEELRRLAASVGGDAGQTLSPTALVNEAYLKLRASLPASPASLLHFKRIAARAMRQVLVESARRRMTRKRGGPSAVVVTLDEGDAVTTTSTELVALDEALRELAALDPRQAATIEYRFFGGYDIAETAELLGASEATVVRDWRAARAWLALRMTPGG